MKIIFLDIDGVLVIRSPDGLSLAAGHNNRPHPECIKNLNKILIATGAYIVISSSWRLVFDLPYIRKWAAANGIIDVIIGATDTGRDRRGNQIRRWWTRHAYDKDTTGEDKLLIIDDDYDAFEGHNYPYIHTRFETGLTAEHVDIAINLLRPRPTY
mgnify:FL=1